MDYFYFRINDGVSQLKKFFFANCQIDKTIIFLLLSKDVIKYAIPNIKPFLYCWNTLHFCFNKPTDVSCKTFGILFINEILS